MFWWNWVGRFNWFLLTWQAVSQALNSCKRMSFRSEQPRPAGCTAATGFCTSNAWKDDSASHHRRGLLSFAVYTVGSAFGFVAADTTPYIWSSYWYISVWIVPMHTVFSIDDSDPGVRIHTKWIGIRYTENTHMQQMHVHNIYSDSYWSLKLGHTCTCIPVSHLSPLLQ